MGKIRKLLPTCTRLERNPANGTLRPMTGNSQGRGGMPLWSVRPLHLTLVVKCGESLRQERTRLQEQTQLLSVDSCLGLSKVQLAPATCQIVLLSSEYLRIPIVDAAADGCPLCALALFGSCSKGVQSKVWRSRCRDGRCWPGGLLGGRVAKEEV